MDAATPALLARGLRGMIGKGGRSPEVVDAMKRHGGEVNRLRGDRLG